MNKNWRKPLTVYNDCGRSMRFFSNSIPSCTRIISSSLSLYVINTVGLSLIQHPWTANFRPCNVRSWIASCVAGKSDVISFDNSSVKWSFINNTLIWNQKTQRIKGPHSKISSNSFMDFPYLKLWIRNLKANSERDSCFKVCMGGRMPKIIRLRDCTKIWVRSKEDRSSIPWCFASKSSKVALIQ